MIDLTKIGSLVSAVSQIGGHLGVDSPIVGQIKGLVSKALPVAAAISDTDRPET